MTDGIRKDTKYKLVNQDVRLIDGETYVVFVGQNRLRAFDEILEYHNDGVMPMQTMILTNQMKKKFADINMPALVSNLENVRPKGNGYFVAKCPSCDDTSGHRLNFSMTGIIKCWGGCKYDDIVSAALLGGGTE